jgi:hypothetical protein
MLSYLSGRACVGNARRLKVLYDVDDVLDPLAESLYQVPLRLWPQEKLEIGTMGGQEKVTCYPGTFAISFEAWK